MTPPSSSTDSTTTASRAMNRTSKDLLGPNDVLLGRGAGPNEHMGNVRFRALVRKAIETFGGLNTKSEGGLLDHKSKAKLAREIIEEVKAKGGRFVKHKKLLGSTLTSPGCAVAPPPSPTNKIVLDCFFEQVDDSTALRMVKQSFCYQLWAVMREDEVTKQEAKNQRAALKSPESIINLGGTISSAPPQLTTSMPKESSAPAPTRTDLLLSSKRELLLADGMARLRQQAQEGRPAAGLSLSYCCSSDYRNKNIWNSFSALGGNPLSPPLRILSEQLSLSTSPSLAAAAGGGGRGQGLVALLHQELLRSFLYPTKEEQEELLVKKMIFPQQQQHGGLGIRQSSSTRTPSYYHPGANKQFLLSSLLARGVHGSRSSGLENSVVAASSSNPTADAAAALFGSLLYSRSLAMTTREVKDHEQNAASNRKKGEAEAS